MYYSIDFEINCIYSDTTVIPAGIGGGLISSMTHLVMIRHDLGLTFLFVGFARDFMVFMTEISFRISFYQPKCLSTNISMSAVIIILNKVIYIRTYFKPLEIINLGFGHLPSGLWAVRVGTRPF